MGKTSWLSEVRKLNYSEKYRVPNDTVLDELYAFVGKQSFLVAYDNGCSYYALNGKDKEVVKFNSSKKTIGLSDKVDEKIKKTIKDIIKTERRAD